MPRWARMGVVLAGGRNRVCSSADPRALQVGSPDLPVTPGNIFWPESKRRKPDSTQRWPIAHLAKRIVARATDDAFFDAARHLRSFAAQMAPEMHPVSIHQRSASMARSMAAANDVILDGAKSATAR